LHSLRIGGAEVLAARLARQLQGRYRFLLVCLDELGTLGEELRTEGFTVEVVERRPGLDLKCAWRLAKLLRREQVDLIHAHQYTPFSYAVLARLLYRGPAILLTEHGRHQPDYPRRKRMLANWLFLERRDRVIGVGEAVRQALIHNEGIPDRRVSVIYNGIDLSPFPNRVNGHLSVRQEMGVAEDDFVILQVARLDYLKDHATAIRTLAQVLLRCPRARLVLVGEGPELQTIQDLVRQHHVESSVRLLGLRKDVPRLLPAADLFLLTSISEGIPLTVIEAMAAGLPVVATRVGGLPEVVEEGNSGLLAPAGNDAALAEKIVQLAEDRQRRQEMGRCGRQTALERFSEKQMHAQYERLYQEMLGA